MNAVIWGTRPCTAIEQAADRQADDPGSASQLTEMLAAFTELPWPLLSRGPGHTRKRPADE